MYPGAPRRRRVQQAKATTGSNLCKTRKKKNRHWSNIVSNKNESIQTMRKYIIENGIFKTGKQPARKRKRQKPNEGAVPWIQGHRCRPRH